MDANEIDDRLWFMSETLGEHYNPDEFWNWLQNVQEQYYSQGYQMGRADALGGL